MTQPSGQQPQGGFGAPYDPLSGTPAVPSQPATAPGFGYPSASGSVPGPYAQQPGPYAQQPGPYGQQLGPYGQQTQGGYGFPPQQAPGGGPHGAGGRGNGRRRFRGKPALIISAVLAVLLVAGGGVWFATSGDDGKKPVAEASGKRPGSSPTADQGDGKGADESDVELAEKLNAQRRPGEAKVRWLQSFGVDLPGHAFGVFGPWSAGDIVAKAVYRTVSGYSVADGKQKWSLRMPNDVCAAPTQPTADGKIVVVAEAEESDNGADCSVLQMIDLKTGKPGWKKTLEKGGPLETEKHVAMSANGETVTYSRPGHVHTYRVGDGRELFGTQPRDCRSYVFTSGPRMIAVADCPRTGGNQVQEFDPQTGKLKWIYKIEKGWFIDQVYSVSPLVISVQKGQEWRLVALRDDGTFRSHIALGTREIDLGFADFEVRCGGYLVVNWNRDDCAGVAADSDTLYVSTRRKHVEFDIDNKIVAFDLNTGKQKWAADAPLGRRMEPLRMEGRNVLLYVAATKTQGGAVGTLAPTGGDPQMVLTHPASTAAIEEGMTAAKVTYAGGRSLLTRPLVGMDEDDEAEASMKTMMAFGE
ncbi:PQQ-binding-like beta-propeller repeat protein [Streptomyces sp. NPDC005525]|uniref:outer membrane protein assembly factor BamB family protein n=1 Tax=Streptomyces sp. NPDC005525 TaxID=3364720 RepID=UPI003685F0B7